MKAIILAAGKGERMRPLTETMPKPMIPISSEPLIFHQIRWLKRAGIKDIVINLHHLADQISGFLHDGRHLGVSISYSHEDEILETGGGIVNALPILGSERFVVLNGDIWTNFDFSTLSRNSALAHLVLVPTPEWREGGDFIVEEGFVRREADIAKRTHVYAGIAVLDPILFDGAPNTPFSLREILFREADCGQLTGQVFSGNWFDIGTHDVLRRVRRLVS